MTNGGFNTPESNGWQTLCRISEIEPGRAKYVELGQRALCVVRQREPESDVVRVFDDACPHAGQSLAGGHVQSGCLVCPWHQWEFGLDDGCNPDNPAVQARIHPSRVIDGVVQAQIKS